MAPERHFQAERACLSQSRAPSPRHRLSQVPQGLFYKGGWPLVDRRVLVGYWHGHLPEKLVGRILPRPILVNEVEPEVPFLLSTFNLGLTLLVSSEDMISTLKASEMCKTIVQTFLPHLNLSGPIHHARRTRAKLLGHTHLDFLFQADLVDNTVIAAGLPDDRDVNLERDASGLGESERRRKIIQTFAH